MGLTTHLNRGKSLSLMVYCFYSIQKVTNQQLLSNEVLEVICEGAESCGSQIIEWENQRAALHQELEHLFVSWALKIPSWLADCLRDQENCLAQPSPIILSPLNKCFHLLEDNLSTLEPADSIQLLALIWNLVSFLCVFIAL